MTNINNYNYNKLKLNLSNHDYWDFKLANDGKISTPFTGVTSGICLVSYFDFANPNTYSSGTTSANTIYSLISWDDAINTGYTFSTYGLTGIDNGGIDISGLTGTSNTEIMSALTGTTLTILSGDTRLELNRVSGFTGNVIYPIDILSANTSIGNYAQLCGGFYQGYYKLDGSTYEVLPNRVSKGWVAEFWLNKTDNCSGYTGTTLNDLNPNNEGFFFYMGTRAENKFWNVFEGLNTGCTSGCTIPSGCTDIVSGYCTTLKETDIVLTGDYNVGIPLSPPIINIDLIKNGFLIYGRASTGGTYCISCGGSHDGLGTYNACTYDGNGVVVTSYQQEITNTTNPFLIYGRASTGGTSCLSCGGNHDGYGTQTACSFSGFTSDKLELDYEADIVDNALGFRIKSDGSIGYRLLTVTGSCSGDTYSSGITVQEGYSASGVVSGDVWTSIIVRFTMNDTYDTCDLIYGKRRKGRLMFYVNGKLKYVVNDFDEFIGKRLGDNKLKQVGVPFNISLGGGSQGLLESFTFDGPDPRDLGLPIEENFAGTFVGGVSQFKFNICDLNFFEIDYLVRREAIRYGITIL
jgi:hypothetical protein